MHQVLNFSHALRMVNMPLKWSLDVMLCTLEDFSEKTTASRIRVDKCSRQVPLKGY
jgi:hypothetical protein